MAIRFKCDCGAEMAIPDGNDASAVLCPSCGKSVKVPAAALEAAPTGDESPSALFRAAIEAFNETNLAAPGAAGPGASTDAPAARPSDTSDILMSAGAARQDSTEPQATPPPDANTLELAAKPSDEIPAAAPAAHEARPGGEAPPGESAARGEDDDEMPLAVSPDDDAPATPASAETVGQHPGVERQDVLTTKDAMPAADAVSALEQRRLRKAVHREGEGDVPGAVYEPKDAESHGNVIKFHCRCGKRISAPANPKKSIGRCPKCGTRLALPRPGTAAAPPREAAAAAPSPPPAHAVPRAPEPRKPHAQHGTGRAEAVRTAVTDAADRLRKRSTPGATGAPAAAAAPREGTPEMAWAARFVAFQIDLAIVAAAFFASAFALREIPLGSSAWVVGGVMAAAAWAANKAVLVAVSGGSCGMLLSGLRLRTELGARAGFGVAVVRAGLGALLVWSAPFALRDPRGRSLTDRIAGTQVVAIERG